MDQLLARTLDSSSVGTGSVHWIPGTCKKYVIFSTFLNIVQPPWGDCLLFLYQFRAFDIWISFALSIGSRIHVLGEIHWHFRTWSQLFRFFQIFRATVECLSVVDSTSIAYHLSMVIWVTKADYFYRTACHNGCVTVEWKKLHILVIL